MLGLLYQSMAWYHMLEMKVLGWFLCTQPESYAKIWILGAKSAASASPNTTDPTPQTSKLRATARATGPLASPSYPYLEVEPDAAKRVGG